ncbi:MAG: hypothetical protein JW765_06050, partial [Deltaproteobacteria bacterium]|nr:hypothetical protein [Candidatus Zymogenaceae bacterium]
MNRNTSLICSLIFILCLSFGGASFIYGNFPDLSFEDLTKTADLIFIGTVVGRDCVTDRSEKMVFTHVHFAEIQVIHARPGSVQARLQTVRLIHPGGRLPDRAVWISAAPRFEPGRRYLVF